MLPTPTATEGSLDLKRNGGSTLRQAVERDEDLLPTPRANEGTGVGEHGQGGQDLRTTVHQHLLKTPTAQLAVNGGSQPPDKRRAGGHGPTLADQVEHTPDLLPTPDASMGDRGPRSAEATAAGDRQRNLNDIPALLPTPTAVESDGSTTHKGGNLRLTGAICGVKPGDRARHEAAGRRVPEGGLLPTPTSAAADGTNERRGGARSDELLLPGVARALAEGDDLLPTPTAWEQRSDPATDDRNLLPLAVQRLESATDDEALLATPRATRGGSSTENTNALLATPRAQHGEPRNQNVWARDPSQPQNLENQLARLEPDEPLLPTPVTKPDRPQGVASDAGKSLLHEVEALFPTPTCADDGGPQTLEARQSRGHGAYLVDLPELLPTPLTSDPAHRSRESADKRAESGFTDLVSAVLYKDDDDEPEPGDEQLLPTPNPFHLANTEHPDEWLERRAEVEARTGTRHGPALGVVVESAVEGRPLYQGGEGPTRLEGGRPEAHGVTWGPYARAVHRWEALIGREVPAPTEPGSKGTPRLSPRFVEWMMGLPAGWVTEVPGLRRNAQLKALGNGVVPQQAAAAVRHVLERMSAPPAVAGGAS